MDDNLSIDDHRIKDRFVNRRKMAWRSFYAFSGMGIFLVLFGLLGGEGAAATVQAIWLQAAFIMGLWGSVVAAYMASAWSNDQTEIKTGVEPQYEN